MIEGPRFQILTLLQRHGQASVDQVSREMEFAPATVRRHLDILQRDQLVAFRQLKKKTGRPEYTYYLTDAGQEFLPKEYGRLLGRLLRELSGLSLAEAGGRSGNELLRFLFHRLASRTATRAGGTPEDSFDQRVTRAVAVLQRERFDPEVQKENGSVRILLHNCPFRTVAMQNDSVCTYDSMLLTGILGTSVTQEQCIHRNDTVCCYVVSPPSAE